MAAFFYGAYFILPRRLSPICLFLDQPFAPSANEPTPVCTWYHPYLYCHCYFWFRFAWYLYRKYTAAIYYQSPQKQNPLSIF